VCRNNSALRLLVTKLDPSKALEHATNAHLADFLREEATEETEESSGERMTTYCTCNAYSEPSGVCKTIHVLIMVMRLNQQLGPSYPTRVHDQHLPHAHAKTK
jgi:hypothetical protein